MTTRSHATATLLALLTPWLALAEEAQRPLATQPAPWYWHGPMWHAGWGFWWIFPLFMLLMLAGCVVFAVRAWRAGAGAPPCLRGHGGQRPCNCDRDTASALRILDERFARGELPKDEYEEQKAVLQRPAPASGA